MRVDFKGNIYCSRSSHICIVDDSEMDRFIARRSCLLSKLDSTVTWLEFADGPSFLQYLHEDVGKNKACLPDLVLLDINMPGMSGFDVLNRMKSFPFATIPRVMMLTNSQSREDVNNAMSLGANGYQSKPFSLIDYKEFFDSLLPMESAHP